MRTVATHCPYCALQCGTRLTRERRGVSVRPTDFPVNQGGLCQKGWTAPALLDVADRLRHPLVRRGGELVPVSWDTALDTIATRVDRIRAERGPDAIGVFGGGGLTNEKAYLLGKFARLALGTSQIDYNGRFCMSSAAAAGTAAFGLDRGLPFPVTDLGGADVVLLAGANPAETMPPLMQHLRSPELIVIDPRRTATAEQAALHLQPLPGTDLALALGLLHIAVVDGFTDADYIRERTNDFDSAWQRAMSWWPERVERVTGVPVSEQRQAVRMLAEAGSAYVLTGRGAEQHSKGVDTVSGFINLALALGIPGRAGGGYGCLTGQGNGQGGREHGQKADQLPGYRMITDQSAREHVAEIWGVLPEVLPGPGRSAYELLDALGTEDGPSALLVFGSNPAVSAPNAEHVVRRLKSLDLLVVADFVPSETTELADVVLPVTQWAEEEGTMTNLEGRVLRRRRLQVPPGHARSDLEVLHGLATRLGEPGHRYPTRPREVFEELRRASAGGKADYSGISYERLDAGEALHWPCPDGGHPGTPRLFLDGFAHPDGRARFAAVEHRDAGDVPAEVFPLTATTGRVLAQYQSGAQTRRVAELNEASPEVFVEVHPDTATRAGLAEGVLARVTSPRGSTIAKVRLVATMRTDTVFLPFHFPGDGRANLLTGDALDPRSRMPEFKVSSVRIEPHREVVAP
ncbi:molybdopterin oxidoreductase family protein [Saccharopolyspora mangrovi]|uniref:Molybdopterin oxidoreductase family protein n=1 Tax=Saccharopolyspora mangrovi TaxID=3082379 RepID=A0ABU6A419_9PSEU|nr:molybdopterin oxidoreductase family protein [Saccharopolyspora sp. S2-29]MEB3366311.1 molybdopterin oxidoreductase family protein [Saccharopolyspora sp. S2-29]